MGSKTMKIVTENKNNIWGISWGFPCINFHELLDFIIIITKTTDLVICIIAVFR